MRRTEGTNRKKGKSNLASQAIFFLVFDQGAGRTRYRLGIREEKQKGKKKDEVKTPVLLI